MSICRTCLSAQDLLDLFSVYDANQLQLTTGIQISPNDEYPHKICKACTKLVDAALLLREQSSYAQDILAIGQTDCPPKKKPKLKEEKYYDDLLTYDDMTDDLVKFLCPVKVEVKLEKAENRKGKIKVEKSMEMKKSIKKIPSKVKTCTRPRKQKDQNDILHLSNEMLDLLNEEDVNRDITEAEVSKVYEMMDAELKASKNEESREKLREKIKLKTVKKRPKNPVNRKRCSQLWSLAQRPVDRAGIVTCIRCQKQFPGKYFMRHATTHFEAEFTCETCGLKFININTMRTHQQRRHGSQRKFACAQCDYRAVLKEELLNHENRVHTGLRPFVCDSCGANFCQRRTLVQHMRSHTNPEKIFQCEFCSKQYRSRSQWTTHRNAYHLLRYTYFCYLCTYSSSRRQTVRDHLARTHGIVRHEQTYISYSKERRYQSL